MAAITRTHHKDVAKLIRREVEATKDNPAPHVAEDQILAKIDTIAEGLADLFAQDNPRFNRDLFYKACGV
jgi:hypothetical protein